MWSFSQNTLLYRFNVFSILTKHLPLHYACNSCNWRWDSKTSPFCLVPASQFLRRFILTIDLSNFSIWFVVVFSSPVIKSETFASLVVQLVKNPAAVRETCLIPGLGRSPGEGDSYSLQYSGWENSVDGIVHGVEKSRTHLSNFPFFFTFSLTALYIS